jgi:hypothetical protein
VLDALALDEPPVLPVALALLVLPVVLALPAVPDGLEGVVAVEPPAGEAVGALVIPPRAFTRAAIMPPVPDGPVGVALADGAGVEGAAGAGAGALEGVEGAGGEAGRASLLVATIVRSPTWLTVAVFVPLSTRVKVSAPFLTTVT